MAFGSSAVVGRYSAHATAFTRTILSRSAVGDRSLSFYLLHVKMPKVQKQLLLVEALLA